MGEEGVTAEEDSKMDDDGDGFVSPKVFTTGEEDTGEEGDEMVRKDLPWRMKVMTGLVTVKKRQMVRKDLPWRMKVSAMRAFALFLE